MRKRVKPLSSEQNNKMKHITDFFTSDRATNGAENSDAPTKDVSEATTSEQGRPESLEKSDPKKIVQK